MVKSARAHAEILGEPLDAYRLVKALSQTFDRLRDSVGVPAEHWKVTEPISLIAH
jgi:hypothetical protein